MTAEIIKKEKWRMKIAWTKDEVGFGELTMIWDEEKQAFILDSELMGVDFVLEVFKALK